MSEIKEQIVELAPIRGLKTWMVKPVHKRVVITGAKPRIYVEGYTKKDGSYIRFKSRQRAERHIANMEKVRG